MYCLLVIVLCGRPTVDGRRSTEKRGTEDSEAARDGSTYLYLLLPTYPIIYSTYLRNRGSELEVDR